MAFRIRAHILYIELLRNSKGHITRNERFCSLCANNYYLSDNNYDINFMLKWFGTFLFAKAQHHFELFAKKCQNVVHLMPFDTILHLFKIEDPLTTVPGKFLHGIQTVPGACQCKRLLSTMECFDEDCEYISLDLVSICMPLLGHWNSNGLFSVIFGNSSLTCLEFGSVVIFPGGVICRVYKIYCLQNFLIKCRVSLK